MQPFDPFNPLLKTEPYALFKQYRDNAPVQLGCTSSPGYPDTWYFFGFEEARQLLRSPLQEPGNRAIGLSAESDARAIFWKHLSGWPLFQDPPLHTMRRAMLANSFRESALARLNQANQQHAASLAKTLHGQDVNVQEAFAYPLAVGAICRAIGIPAPETLWFKNTTSKLVNVLDLGYVSEAYEPGLAALNELIDFVHDMMRWKINHPGDDLLSSLLAKDPHGETLAKETITELITQILFAGQETVGDAIGNGLHAIIHAPEQLLKLRSQPSLMENFINESLRYCNPVNFLGSRVLKQQATFGDITIPAGAPTIVALASCNHDPRRFDKPDQFDIQRELSGSELSFGHGIHYCLGAHYARQVMKVAFSSLISHLPDNWQLSEPAIWRVNTVLRGPVSLRIRF